MASSSDTDINRPRYYETVTHFPTIINGRINMMEFLESSKRLVNLTERLSKVFAPVKYDMQGNIDKIEKCFNYNENSCLLELMLGQDIENKPDIESVIWLNRAFHFIELIFQEILACIQANNLEGNSKKIFTVAYEASLKKYHSWVTQQIVHLICKMTPSLPTMLKSVECDDLKAAEVYLSTYIIKLHLVRCKIDDFIKDNNLYNDHSVL